MTVRYFVNILCLIVIILVVLIDFLGFLKIAFLPTSIITLVILFGLRHWGHPTWAELKNWLKG